MPVENIPVIAAMFGTFAFGVAMLAEDAKVTGTTDSFNCIEIVKNPRCVLHVAGFCFIFKLCRGGTPYRSMNLQICLFLSKPCLTIECVENMKPLQLIKYSVIL